MPVPRNDKPYGGLRISLAGKLVLKGPATDRAHHAVLNWETEPLLSTTQLIIKFTRPGFVLNAQTYPDYSVCLDLVGMYHVDFSSFFSLDLAATEQFAKRSLSLSWGNGQCANNPSRIQAVMEMRTTREAAELLKTAWYYKACMEQRHRPEWQVKNQLLMNFLPR